MPVTLKIDLNTSRPQQVVIQDASATQDGVMTKLQVQQLATLVQDGPSTDMQWIVTPVQRHDYIAALGEYVPVDSSEVAVNITLPISTPSNKGEVIGVKSVSGIGTDISVDADGGQLVDGQVSYVFSGAFLFESVIFVSNGTGWDIGYYYKGSSSV
jgi:hypothetical protein